MAGARARPGRPTGPRGPGSPFGPGGPWGPTDPRGPAGPWGPGGPGVDATCCILDSWPRLSTTMCARPAMAATATAMRPINHLCIALPLTRSELARPFYTLLRHFWGNTHRRWPWMSGATGGSAPADLGQSATSTAPGMDGGVGNFFADSDAVELCARRPTRSRTSGWSRAACRVSKQPSPHQEVVFGRVRPACSRIIHVLDLRLPGRGGVRANHPSRRRSRPGSL
jgi:hypothetical protein